MSAERSCVDLLRVLQHRGEAEAKDFVRRTHAACSPCNPTPLLALLTLQPYVREAATNRMHAG